MNTQNALEEKNQLRHDLHQKFAALWPDQVQADRCPAFPGKGKAAERLRRFSLYRMARNVAVMPDPVLLQARVNLLNDGKNIVAATPGLKKGFVRLSSQDIPVPQRPRMLTGHSMFDSGAALRFPGAKIGKIDMLIVPCLGFDEKGGLLGDGRGLIDLTASLLTHLGALSTSAPIIALADDEQQIDQVPQDIWDFGANVILTPTKTLTIKSNRPKPDFSKLPERLAHLPVVRGILGEFDY